MQRALTLASYYIPYQTGLEGYGTSHIGNI